MARFKYWTILLGTEPTAFRAPFQEELVPMLKQLLRTNDDAVIKWFERGKIWDSPEAAESARAEEAGVSKSRGKSWRPGGDHKDPREKYKVPRDVRRARMAQREGWGRPEGTEGERPRAPRKPFGGPPRGDRPFGAKPAGERKPWTDKPAGERKPWSGKPAGERKPFNRDRDAGGERKSFGDRKPAGDRKPWGDKPAGERKPFGARKPAGAGKPWGDKPRGAKPGGFGARKPGGAARKPGPRGPKKS